MEIQMSDQLNRRTMLTGAACASVLALPVAATASSDGTIGREAPDPIFAAIEAHQRAWAALCEKCLDLDEAGTPEANAEYLRLDNAVDDAAGGLLDVIPTTIAGVSALLTYAADHACGGNSWPEGYVDENPKTGWDREQGVSWEVILHRNLAKALPKIADTTNR
jgi:hypothetical protein